MARCNFYLNIDEPLSLVLIWFYDIQSKNVLFLLKATETKTAEVFGVHYADKDRRIVQITPFQLP